MDALSPVCDGFSSARFWLNVLFRLPLGVLAVEHGWAKAGCRGPDDWAASEEQNTSGRCLRAPDHGVDAGRVCFNSWTPCFLNVVP